MNHDEMIEVIQAHKDGKTIQLRHKNQPKWVDFSKPLWNFDNTDYRVKPEPREFYIDLNSNGTVQCGLPVRASDGSASSLASETIKVREVIE